MIGQSPAALLFTYGVTYGAIGGLVAAMLRAGRMTRVGSRDGRPFMQRECPVLGANQTSYARREFFRL
jgi:hypothetical protein